MHRIQAADLCSNNARVTTPRRSLETYQTAVTPSRRRTRSYRMGPNSGFEANTTTDFWTVDRVTSASFTRSIDAAI